MMMPTHFILAILVAIPFTFQHPDSYILLLLTSVLFGVLPDIDILFGTHRKTTHYPLVSVLTLVASMPAYLITSSLILSLVVVSSLSMVVHCVADILSSGVEDRPWKQTNMQACYNHIQKKWYKPKFVVPYDGSIQDHILFLILSIVAYYTIPYEIPRLLLYTYIAVFAVATFYTVVRKPGKIYLERLAESFKTIQEEIIFVFYHKFG